LTVKDGAYITITGTATDGTRIEVAASAKATITLDDVSISGLGAGSSTSRWLIRYKDGLKGGLHIQHKEDPNMDIGLGANQSPLALGPGARVKLNLRGSNTLTAGDCTLTKPGYCAGIEVPGGAMLDIDGAGALTAMGGSGFGVAVGNSGYCGGGGRGGRCVSGGGGTVIISGGAVTANCSDANSHGGGGGGIYSGGGTIIINGGTVTACDIYGGENGTITISGGVVTAKHGIKSGDGGVITISGGEVTANGGIGGYIGSGPWSVDKDLTVTISGGTVTATGNSTDAGIGGSIYGTNGTIIIDITGDANVTAQGGDGNTLGGGSGGGAGIGGNGSSYGGEVGTIKIDTTGTVKATGGKGFQGGSAGANIGQGGRVIISSSEASTGAGIKSVSGPTPASASVAVGGTVSFTCDVTAMPNTPVPNFALSLQFSSRAAAPKEWAPTTVTEGGASAVFTLPNVTPGMAGQYRCVVLATDFPRGGRHKDDADKKGNAPASSIRYVSSAATLTVTPN